MRVDFYQLSRSSAEDALPLIARASLTTGERLVIVSGDEAQLERIDRALWDKLPESFLAHGRSGGPHHVRQPILLALEVERSNNARYLALADGTWRDAEGFERVFYFFDEPVVTAARTCWRMLGERNGVERRFWKQQGRGWVEGP